MEGMELHSTRRVPRRGLLGKYLEMGAGGQRGVGKGGEAKIHAIELEIIYVIVTYNTINKMLSLLHLRLNVGMELHSAGRVGTS